MSVRLLASMMSPLVGGGGTPGTITIDHTKAGTADSTDFVMLFSSTFSYLKTVGNGGSVQNANGYDIRFTSDSAGLTNLKWEVIKYDATTGQFVARVKIPTLSHTSDTVIYLKYGDNTITTFQGGTAGSVWDADFKSAWGFGDGTTLSLTDSTTNANNGTNHNTATAQAGPNGLGAVKFVSASSQYISTPNTINLTHPTVEAWFNLASATSFSNAIVGFANGYLNGLEDKDITISNAAAPSWYIFDGGGKTLNGSNLSTAVWHHLVGTADGSTQRLYVDGTEITNQAAGNAYTGAAQSVFIGGGFRSLASSDAAVAEVRVSDIARSASYVTATYNSINSPSTFYTVT